MARGGRLRRILAITLFPLLSIGPAVALPVVVEPGPTVAGSELAVEPAVLRPDPGTTALLVRLGADAPSPVVLTLRAVAAEVTTEGTARAGDRSAAWLTVPPTSTLLRPGERLRVPVVVSAPPPGAVGAVVVRGTPPTGPATEVTALVLASGDPGTAGPLVTATRSDGVVAVEVVVARPSLVTVSIVGRDVSATLPDRVVVPATPLRVEVGAGALPTPLAVSVVDDAGREATAVTAWAVRPAVVAGTGLLVTALAVVLVLLVRARRR